MIHIKHLLEIIGLSHYLLIFLLKSCCLGTYNKENHRRTSGENVKIQSDTTVEESMGTENRIGKEERW